MKDRFFTTQRALGTARAAAQKTEVETASIEMNTFKEISIPRNPYKMGITTFLQLHLELLEQDIKRKRQMEILYHRSLEQLEEEERVLARYASITLVIFFC